MGLIKPSKGNLEINGINISNNLNEEVLIVIEKYFSCPSIYFP